LRRVEKSLIFLREKVTARLIDKRSDKVGTHVASF
jgi:hypothetical protein